MTVSVWPARASCGEMVLLKLKPAVAAVSVAEPDVAVPRLVLKEAAGLTKLPAAGAVTLTVTVQVPLAATLPADSATLLAPAVAVTLPPVHVVLAPAGEAICRPLGSASVKASPLTATEFAALLTV